MTEQTVGIPQSLVALLAVEYAYRRGATERKRPVSACAARWSMIHGTVHLWSRHKRSITDP